MVDGQAELFLSSTSRYPVSHVGSKDAENPSSSTSEPLRMELPPSSSVSPPVSPSVSPPLSSSALPKQVSVYFLALCRRFLNISTPFELGLGASVSKEAMDRHLVRASFTCFSTTLSPRCNSARQEGERKRDQNKCAERERKQRREPAHRRAVADLYGIITVRSSYEDYQ